MGVSLVGGERSRMGCPAPLHASIACACFPGGSLVYNPRAAPSSYLFLLLCCVSVWPPRVFRNAERFPGKSFSETLRFGRTTVFPSVLTCCRVTCVDGCFPLKCPKSKFYFINHPTILLYFLFF